ncbi:MAG: hypothetical protein EOP84_20905, partial [Verrucomicrobiaceae bacterium]
MKLLLSNDDGIDAPGLQALLAAARPLGDPVVVAPAGPQSGMSHAVTYESALRIDARGENRFAVSGTPADCTRLGLIFSGTSCRFWSRTAPPSSTSQIVAESPQGSSSF